MDVESSVVSRDRKQQTHGGWSHDEDAPRRQQYTSPISAYRGSLSVHTASSVAPLIDSDPPGHQVQLPRECVVRGLSPTFRFPSALLHRLVI